MNAQVYKGVLISQSVSAIDAVLENVTVVDQRNTTLEGESFRGPVTFYNIEVSEHNLWAVLHQVARTIKSPGWYFHLVNKEILYIVMPNAILIAGNDEAELVSIVDYAKSQGIHPDQLNLKQLFEDPYA